MKTLIAITLLFGNIALTASAGEGRSGKKRFDLESCQTAYEKITQSSHCGDKETLFNSNVVRCENRVLRDPKDDAFTFPFKEAIIEVGDCYEKEKKVKEAIRVYRLGLNLKEYLVDWHTHESSFHDFLLALIESLGRKAPNKCVSESQFEEMVDRFARTKNLKPLSEIVALEPFNVGLTHPTDAPFFKVAKYISRAAKESSLKVVLKENNCIFLAGWNRNSNDINGFCFKVDGETGCVYWNRFPDGPAYLHQK